MTCCVICSLPRNSSVPQSAPLSPDVTFRMMLHCTGKTQATATTLLWGWSSSSDLQRHMQPSGIRRSWPHRAKSLTLTFLLRKKKTSVPGLQTHLLEKGIIVLWIGLLLILKTNATFLKDIINNPSKLPLLSSEKGWGCTSSFISVLADFPVSFLVFPLRPGPRLPLPLLSSTERPLLWATAAEGIPHLRWVRWLSAVVELPVGKIGAWQAVGWKDRSSFSVEQCYLNNDGWETSPVQA